MTNVIKTRKLPKRKKTGVVYDHSIVKVFFSIKEEMVPEKQRGRIMEALLPEKAG